jgi:hypothetical protein
VIMWLPVSVCHQVSTMSAWLLPTTCWGQWGRWAEGQGRTEGGGRSWIRGQVWGARGGLRNTSHYRDHTELPDHSTAQRTARTSWYQRQASGLMGSPTVPRMRREVRLQAGGQMMGRH